MVDALNELIGSLENLFMRNGQELYEISPDLHEALAGLSPSIIEFKHAYIGYKNAHQLP